MDYRLASKKFWQTIRCLNREKQYLINTVYSGSGELLTSAGKGLLWGSPSQILLPFVWEAETEESEVDSFIIQAEVTEVGQKCLSGKALGVDEIHPTSSTSSLWMFWGCLGWHAWTGRPEELEVEFTLLRGSLFQAMGEENLSDSWTSNSGGTTRFSSWFILISYSEKTPCLILCFHIAVTKKTKLQKVNSKTFSIPYLFCFTKLMLHDSLINFHIHSCQSECFKIHSHDKPKLCSLSSEGGLRSDERIIWPSDMRKSSERLELHRPMRPTVWL